ncbi:amidohydrolase family protein [Robertmurraya korlensis]|uniref:amidohydrolase family protein n=1 Tax=Robertmurraya korlensis TaxID=519977 RepID=UPI000825B913|nr:amidohydrolase family protein [Robertmurraya korlensis]
MDNDQLPSTGWNAQETITLAESLMNYTVTPAFGSFREKDLGTLSAGKLADIIVLNQNLFDIATEDILNTKVVLTMVDGKVIYNSES